MSGAEKREKMAVMETAISSSLSHPNVVATYTYAVTPVLRPAAAAPQSGADPSSAAAASTACSGGGGGSGPSASAAAAAARPRSSGVDALHGYEVRLVLEYCDKGTLREALSAGAFHPARRASIGSSSAGAGATGAAGGGASTAAGTAAAAPPAPQAAAVATRSSSLPTGDDAQPPPSASGLLGSGSGAAGASGVDLAGVLATALDVARAMAFLHDHGVVHADLKVRVCLCVLPG